MRGSLEDLDLSKNRIQSLAGIGRLCNLKRVNVAHNEIRHLPEQMKLVTGLAWLDLSCNKLSNLGQTCSRLYGCRRLFWLEAKGNPFASNPKYRSTVAAMMPTVIYLDQVVLDHASASETHNQAERSKSLSISNGEEKTAVETERMRNELSVLKEENERLRSEMDATSQLLARKTSEWAVAEESASRYQQELAFLRIERPQNGQSGAKPAAVSDVPRSVNDEVIQQGEEVLREASLRQQRKLEAIDAEKQQLDREIASLEPLLVAAEKNLSDSCQELDAVHKKLATMGENIHSCQFSDSSPVRIGAELSKLVEASKVLEELQTLVQEKVEICQDMLVLRTEALIRDSGEAAGELEQGDSIAERKGRLMIRFKKVSSSIESNAKRLDHAILNEELMKKLCSTNIAEVALDGITALSELLESAQEEEREVSTYAAACTDRVKTLKAAVFAKNTGGVETKHDSEVEALKMKAKEVQQKVETDRAGKSALEEELTVLRKRRRDLEVSFLRTKCSGFEEENQVRVKQK